MKGTAKIVMLVRRDSDGNRKLEDAEEELAFLVNLDRADSPREIFAQEKTRMKELFDRDWQRIK